MALQQFSQAKKGHHITLGKWLASLAALPDEKGRKSYFPLGVLQAWRAQGKRYNIIGNVSYFEVNGEVASSALYWNACTCLNQLFTDHDTLKEQRFTRQRTSEETDTEVKSWCKLQVSRHHSFMYLCKSQFMTPFLCSSQNQERLASKLLGAAVAMPDLLPYQ